MMMTLCLIQLTSCSRENNNVPQTTTFPMGGENGIQLIDYGDPGLQRLKRKLNHSDKEKIHILQLGDSHTASDFFSGQLRRHFKQQYGDGGVGFISPLAISGNRFDNVLFSNANGWDMVTSRKTTNAGFTLGGNIATPRRDNNDAELVVRDTDPAFLMQALYRNQANGKIQIQHQTIVLPCSQSRWVLSQPVTVQSPVRYSLAPSGGSQLAGWLLSSSHRGGVMLSALGINGARVSMLDKWRDNWLSTLQMLKPDMVVMAYGTNEAFDQQLDIQRYQQNYSEYVQAIRRVLPEAVILLVGPGSSISNKNGASCRQHQPVLLKPVIQAQREVAQSYHTLFWSWFDYMGGDCAIERWQQQGIARPDLIHLTQQGYQRSADALWRQFVALLNATQE
ncbi:SGNH/GDSL hydrolase family protein [Dickeya chrysanthemi]|uniref:SGNH/GDSL hydrolase family protein n=1 Tax=Dickeya chrysanthemi TaxID=556 RepID=UPI0009DF06E7|nr:SGNH/GDSL hydrolase family protein [Dickeya chrysanthemi]